MTDRAAPSTPRIHDRFYLQLLVACIVAIACTLVLLVVTEQRFAGLIQRQQVLIRAQVVLYNVRLELRELQQISVVAPASGSAADALRAFNAVRDRIDALGREFSGDWSALGFAEPDLRSAETYLQNAVAMQRARITSVAGGRATAGTPDLPTGQFTAALRAIEVRLAGEARRLAGLVARTYWLDRALLLALLAWSAALVLLAISKYRRRLRLLGAAYQEVRATQGRYEQLLGAANEGILIVGPQGEVRNVNRRFAEFVDLEPAALIGEYTSRLAATGKPLLQVIDAAARSRDGLTIHVSVPNVDSPVRWLHLECRPGGDSADTIAVVVDVTRAREIELFQRRATRHLETLIANLPLAAISFDVDGRVIEANAAWLKLFRMTDIGAARTAWARVASEGYREHIEAVRRSALAGQLVHQEELRLPSGDGGYRHVNLWAAPLFDVAGTIIGVISIGEDVSERVSRMAEQARRAELTRRALIREIHHRANNSLQGVVGLLSESAAGSGLSASDVAPAIARVQSMAAVHGVIAAQAGDSIDVVTLIREVAHQVAGALGAAITIDTAGAPFPCFAVAPTAAESLAIVVGELVTNAVKHGRWAGADMPRVQLAISTDEGCVRVQVRNPGAIARAGASARADQRGGLGLELVRALLPDDGASLRLWEDSETEVVAEIRLGPPQIAMLALSA